MFLGENFNKGTLISDTRMAYVVQEANVISNAKTYAFNTLSAFTLCLNVPEILSVNPFQVTDSEFPASIPFSDGCFSPEVFEFIINQQKL